MLWSIKLAYLPDAVSMNWNKQEAGPGHGSHDTPFALRCAAYRRAGGAFFRTIQAAALAGPPALGRPVPGFEALARRRRHRRDRGVGDAFPQRNGARLRIFRVLSSSYPGIAARALGGRNARRTPIPATRQHVDRPFPRCAKSGRSASLPWRMHRRRFAGRGAASRAWPGFRRGA